MGNAREKLPRNLVLKMVSLRDARFLFLCCMKMQMQAGFFFPLVLS